jgi:hypothetical protein
MIGWEDDNNILGPIAAAAKQSLLRLILHIMPADSDQASLYGLVLDHGDFGIHNMSITKDANCQPLVTSLYDWEAGCIVPAILSDPLIAVAADLATDDYAAPSITRVSENATPDDRARYMTWAGQYFKLHPPFKHFPSQCMNREATTFLRAGFLQSSSQLRTCNPGRERCTPPLVCVARVAR